MNSTLERNCRVKGQCYDYIRRRDQLFTNLDYAAKLTSAEILEVILLAQ